MAKILMVVAQKGFKDEECLVPKEALEAEGHKITIASLTRETAIGAGGTELKPDMAVYEANAEFFDCVIIVGGPGSPVLAEKQEVLKLVKGAYDNEKLVAAICIAPIVLANAGILQGKKATVFPSPDAVETLKAQGAQYTKQPVVVDGRIVTADGPQSAGKFGHTIAGMLK